MNRNVVKFLDKLRVETAIVYGVATDYCVKDAVVGLLKRGIKVSIVEDAVKGIDGVQSNKVLMMPDVYLTTTIKVVD